MRKLAVLNEKVKDFLMGFEVIKTFGIEENVRRKFSKTALDAEKSRYEANRVSVKVGTVSGTFMVATQIITYLVAGYFVISGSITIGAVIAIAGLSGTVMQPINLMAINLSYIKSTKDIRDGLLQVVRPGDSRQREKTAAIGLGITLNNLSYEYKAQATNVAGGAPRKPSVRFIPMDGRTVEETLASVGINSADDIQVMNASDMKPETIPFTEAGEPDIAAILAQHGYHDVDMSQVQVFQADSVEDVSDVINNVEGVVSAPQIPAGAVLKNVSYSFKAGGKYAIVGGSGSGKSTLLKILMGYYDDYLGEVQIGEYEVRDIDRESLYRSMSMMHQNVFLLDDTLRNNITLDNPYTDEEYLAAIVKSQLTDVVNALPEGSMTNVGEGGNTMSGGERQRIAIARALIKKTEIILFDEATSALDNETQCDIQAAINNMKGEHTILIIAHRLSTVIESDRIIVIDDGKIINEGTHKQLLKTCKMYKDLYENEIVS